MTGKTMFWQILKSICLFLASSAVAAVIGLCCVILPPYVIPGSIEHPYSGWTLFPWFQTAINNVVVFPTLMLLLILGGGLGFAQPRVWWLFGPISVILLPVFLIADIIHFPASHNLWPFEIVGYMSFCVPTLIGAFIGMLLKKEQQNGNGNPAAPTKV
jgi:hypothetical protein